MMTQEKFMWCLKELNKYKGYFGFGDWTVGAEDCTDQESDCVAEAETDQWKQQVKVKFYKDFLERDDSFETIIHELIHARIGVAQDKVAYMTEKIEYKEEEEAVNDITRGIMELMKNENSD